jgi:hypothetical protein
MGNVVRSFNPVTWWKSYRKLFASYLFSHHSKVAAASAPEEEILLKEEQNEEPIVEMYYIKAFFAGVPRRPVVLVDQLTAKKLLAKPGYRIYPYVVTHLNRDNFGDDFIRHLDKPVWIIVDNPVKLMPDKNGMSKRKVIEPGSTVRYQDALYIVVKENYASISLAPIDAPSSGAEWVARSQVTLVAW